MKKAFYITALSFVVAHVLIVSATCPPPWPTKQVISLSCSPGWK